MCGNHAAERGTVAWSIPGCLCAVQRYNHNTALHVQSRVTMVPTPVISLPASVSWGQVQGWDLGKEGVWHGLVMLIISLSLAVMPVRASPDSRPMARGDCSQLLMIILCEKFGAHLSKYSLFTMRNSQILQLIVTFYTTKAIFSP